MIYGGFQSIGVANDQIIHILPLKCHHPLGILGIPPSIGTPFFIKADIHVECTYVAFEPLAERAGTCRVLVDVAILW